MKTKYREEKDLSDINNLSDLQKEIAQLKLSIKIQENELQERLKEVPKESLKVAAAAVLPKVVQKAILAKSLQPVFNLGKSLLFPGKRGSHDLKDSAISFAKGVGIFASAKTILGWLKKRKNK
ncbi:MAG: hypothetical protein JSS67_07295 [Bacteroidetes bacterium]|nr:hypothetical protein [Bacteroidota bacterium]